MNYSLPTEALERLDTFIAEDRIIRHKWTGKDKEGRETACLLAALDPERINHADKCPAWWLPPWLAHLTPALDDHVSDVVRPSVIKRYQRILHHIHRLTPEGSDRAMWRTIDAALVIAEPHDIAGVVATVRALIAQKLAGVTVDMSKWQEAKAAAEAAVGSAAAAWAAAEAAKAAAAWAAAAAAEAAAEAAEAAAEAAKAKAWDKIADACLGALEAELGLEAV